MLVLPFSTGHGKTAASASIPSKYQTIVSDNSERKGFLSRSKRFEGMNVVCMLKFALRIIMIVIFILLLVLVINQIYWNQQSTTYIHRVSCIEYQLDTRCLRLSSIKCQLTLILVGTVRSELITPKQ